jgi:capsular polysaccharide export protein
MPVMTGPADPWHLAEQPDQLWVGAGLELELVAALVGRSVSAFGGRTDHDITLAELARNWDYRCPFTGESMPIVEAVELLAGWRRTIDGNRSIEAAIGIARWKRSTVDPLLWNGTERPRYRRALGDECRPGTRYLVWKSRTSPELLRRLEAGRAEIAEIEDGMIRGPGLGANCVPPLSVVVDHAGIYFDPGSASDLERHLQSAEFPPVLVERAAKLRRRIVEMGVSKYGAATAPVRARDDRRRILVVGQVEDDRSVLEGGSGRTNLDLIDRARQLEPSAWLVYRPHPDVVAGHRPGRVGHDTVMRFANEIDGMSSIADLIDSVDAVHTLTSLAGFEALLREKPVTTHGTPFYAGWGLTRDLADVPERRSRRLTLDELVAATLILYPRYLDPVTRLPCSPEILLDRIAAGRAAVPAPLSAFRRIQGRLKLGARRSTGGRSR